MEFKNSYIFLKRKSTKKENEKAKEKEDKKNIKLSPTFMQLMKKAFDEIEFESEKHNLINNGSIVIRKNKNKKKVLFKYNIICGNCYLDIKVNSNCELTAIGLLNDVNKKLISKNNCFDEFYISIISYDYISEYYCNRLFPYLNEFERKLRKLLFNVYTLNFDLEYYSATPNKELQGDIKKKSIELNKELNEMNSDNISKNDCLTKYGFYSLEYSDIDKLLFSDYVSEKDKNKLQDFLKNNEDLSKVGDEELREKFELLKPKHDWDRFFKNKRMGDDFQIIFGDIHRFRNNIAHCKFVSKRQYTKCLSLLKHNIELLDIAISISEEKDFFKKNIELQQDSFDRMSKMLREAVYNFYKPFLDNIELLTQSTKQLSDRILSTNNSLSNIISTIPSIVLPEIELTKYDIPKYFNDDEKYKN